MNKIVVIVEHEDGKVYQVALSHKENDAIVNVLMSLHDNKVKCIPTPLDLTITPKTDTKGT